MTDLPPLDRLIGVNDFPTIINGWLSLRGRRKVTGDAARQWWHRGRELYGWDPPPELPYLAAPLPAPILVGILQERPMWEAWRIVEWYADWKGIMQPEEILRRRAIVDAYAGDSGDVVVSVMGRVERGGDGE